MSSFILIPALSVIPRTRYVPDTSFKLLVRGSPVINSRFSIKQLFEPINNCSNNYQNVEQPSTVETTSLVQAYRANIQQRVYDLTKDVFFMLVNNMEKGNT